MEKRNAVNSTTVKMLSMFRFLVITSIVSISLLSCNVEKKASVAVEPKPYSEVHRPQFHFTPPAHWMNDPNGMVYYKGEYHLFYQHYPDSTVWGPMHWGHAVSRDLVHWEHLPIALYPDSIGMIFSGSAVVDEKNTSGFGTTENPPIVAIFTYHAMEKEKAGRTDYQTQGIAYSLDSGRTWKKYEANPVLPNQGVKDFRDPKVMWHEASKKWVMTLAALDHVEFYSSPDLKSWSKLSDFGKDYGSHGGVWECPDLFQLSVEGTQAKKWVMLLSINPGGPNGGSGTQYFIGNFDGKKFISETPKTDTLWIDYGADNYAGVTWSGIPAQDGRRIFLGWMSNWNYANVVPTDTWRSAMTVPRELKLKKLNGKYYLRSFPVRELEMLGEKSKTIANVISDDKLQLVDETEYAVATSRIRGSVDANDFEIVFSNTRAQQVVIGYDKKTNRYFIDRSKSGKTGFSNAFNAISYAPRISNDEKIKFDIVTDVSSVEAFFDDGTSVLTNIFFPDENYNRVHMLAKPVLKIDSLKIEQLMPVW
jgi:fructan beta-fructosidase